MADILSVPNSVEEKLAVHLCRAAGKTIRWGEHDYGLWLADWAMLREGIADPAANFRGRYTNGYQGARISAWPLCVGRIARSIGWRRKTAPDVGDIAVLFLGNATGAIRTTFGWAVLSGNGIARIPADFRVIGAWGP